jgi:tetratricopeptide (TPR) repeat protein
MAEQKLKVVNFHESDWEFVFPPSIDNEGTYNEYYEGVELLGYNDEAAEQIFKRIIKKHPYHIDAYNHLSLAFKNQKKTFESLLTAEKAYMLGKLCLPKEFKQSKHKLSWGNLNNRPFLRSCQILGLEYQDRKQYREAIYYYTEILDYNEGDNQGARYLLLQCLFALKDYEAASTFLKKHKEDWGIDFVYGKLLLAIINNKNATLKALLADALKRNKFVPEEIVKSKHVAPISFRIADGFTLGSEQEAYEYWRSNKTILSDKRIKTFLAENAFK